jgi:hypothetical protein
MQFLCSLDQNPDFDTEDNPRNPAAGLIEFIGERSAGSKKLFRYKGRLIFHKFLGGPPSTEMVALGEEVFQMLPSGASLACRVRILAYLTPEYFSETLHIPNDTIKALARKMDAAPM